MAIPPRVQYGALPWRMRDGTLEILLLTSRGTGRWIIPKGWPHDNFSSAHSAAQEAYEEAGIRGPITSEPIGSYRYQKVRDEGATVDCVVYVHAMEVAQHLDDWPEKDQRQQKWFPRNAAAEAVSEPELRDLILAFQPLQSYS
ncbi:NUDIX hydrolase [Oricola thermophila]|uniref:NUDIX hydrolase n=2 Tax=Oricola thermophila TaxID=2742145 RepID=A0A6N1VL36_9HYPH|nr:NUDIX hydrolase [Oricola thermophila]